MTTEAQEKEAEIRDQKAVAQHLGVGTGGNQITRLQVKSFGELENLAMILGKSDIVPKDMIGKPANIMLALMFANEVGLSPAQGLQNVMVVNGRPSLWGDAVMGLVENSGLQEWWKDEYKPDLDGGTHCFTTKRKGRDPVTRTFSMKDAAQAKLDKKEGPWQGYPKRMLFNRARAWSLRDTYSDVLKGIRVYEEERDVIETTATPGPTYDLPKETTAPAAAAAAPTPPAPAPAPAPMPAAPAPVELEASFRIGYGAAAKLEDGHGFVLSDDAEPPVKYYHDSKDWAATAKVAKDAKAFVAVRWIEKKTAKGPIRWLVALSLKS